uniref:MATH domain-containing protein n=1 Tax=Strigamia maritima TaxID=126957 RepID=T1IJI5_STRMM
MDSVLITCFKCDAKNLLPVQQLSGDVYCQRCGRGLHQKAGIDSHLQEELCSYCNRSVDPDKIKSHNDFCDMFPINCSFCNRKFIRQTMNVHERECDRNLRWCKYSPMGCQFQGTQLETEKHEVGNFHVELMMKLLLNLQTEQSSNATVLARSLNELMSLKDDNARRNSSAGVECQDVILQQNECFIKMKVKQDNMEEIIRKQEMEINSCKLEYDEMEETIRKQEMEINLCKQKMDELMTQNSQWKHEYGLVKDMFGQQSKEVQKLEESLTALTKQQTEQCDKVENHENTLNAVITANNQLTKSVAEDKKFLSDKMDDLSRKQKGLEDDLARDKDKLDKNCTLQKEMRQKLGKLENNCNQQNETRKKVDEMELECRNKCSSFEYVWKVENFARVQQSMKSGTKTDVFSDPFYSSEFGYKMRLQLYPNGNGVGMGTHLSIFLQVMKGPHDAVLKWPIEYRASFSVLDQSTHQVHLTYTLEYDLIKFREDYAKPIDEFNTGLGFSTFISLDVLKPLYLVDDAIFFKVEVKITL